MPYDQPNSFFKGPKFKEKDSPKKNVKSQAYKKKKITSPLKWIYWLVFIPDGPWNQHPVLFPQHTKSCSQAVFFNRLQQALRLLQIRTSFPQAFTNEKPTICFLGSRVKLRERVYKESSWSQAQKLDITSAPNWADPCAKLESNGSLQSYYYFSCMSRISLPMAKVWIWLQKHTWKVVMIQVWKLFQVLE